MVTYGYCGNNYNMKISWELLRKAGLTLFCAAAACGSVHSYLQGAVSETIPVLYEPAPVVLTETERSELPAPEKTDPRIDLNSATEEELCTLKGIGPAKAAAVVAYRESYGGFVCIEEIMEVKGIGPGTFEKIREFLYIGDGSEDL